MYATTQSKLGGNSCWTLLIQKHGVFFYVSINLVPSVWWHAFKVISILTQIFLSLLSSSTGITGNSIHHFIFLKATEINYVVYYHRRYINQNRTAEQIGISESPQEVLCHWCWYSSHAQTKSCVLKREKKDTPTELKLFSYYLCMIFTTKWKIIIIPPTITSSCAKSPEQERILL